MAETLPYTYFLTLGVLGILAAFSVMNFQKLWSFPFLAVLFTFGFWYMVEPIYTPEEFNQFSRNLLEDAYFYSLIFLLSFAIFFFFLSPLFRPARARSQLRADKRRFQENFGRAGERLVFPLALIWLGLIAYGSFRLGGDVLQALFPLEGRSGPRMWQRSAGAGAGITGFLVSTASYLYLMVCAAFGAMLPLAKKSSTRAALILLICLSWPYLFLQGSRNQALIAFLPLVITYFIFGRSNALMKYGLVIAGAALIYIWFGIVIEMRTEQAALTEIALDTGVTHLGLNMASELCWMLHFQQTGLAQPSWGGGYLAEALNWVPRAIWPSKPMIGIDYAILRGFGGTGRDIGVVATISTGMIGQGIANFGPLLGSAFAGFAMAVWANFLWRLRLQANFPRLLLFALGLALTINLGRDITLLTLFPFVFGYLCVLAIEYVGRRNRARMRSRRNSDSRSVSDIAINRNFP